ncbi:MAG: protein kinase [Xanthomonadales bacterium]|nr:protein kinase [Xanthomonadales bacterium]
MTEKTEKDGPIELSNYRIEGLLDRGGMGAVYLADQLRPKRKVAINVIAPDDFPRMDHDVLEGVLAMLQQEGDVAARFDHENLITVYECGVENDHYYLAMEFLPGGSLRQRIGSEGMDAEDACNIVRQVASGLSDMHEQGILHRDIKPENVMFRKNGKAVLMDYGVAKDAGTISKLTELGLSTGTPDYMSPEQIDGRPIDGRSDLYALGIMFYEMLTGEVPFKGSGRMAIAYAHVNHPIPNLPEPLSNYQPIIDGLLAKDPEDRIETADDLIDKLDSIGESAPEAPVSAPTRLTPIEQKQTPSEEPGIFSELKRRKVFRSAGVYGVTAFGLTEILTFIFDNFNAPLWTSKLVAALFVAGFPIAMFLSWAFDFEPGGQIKKTEFIGQKKNATPILVSALLMLVVATGGLFYLIFPRGQDAPAPPVEQAARAQTEPPSEQAAPTPPKLTNAMAILPFTYQSSDASLEFLSSGMAETLLSKLQVVKELTVISNSSSARFADHPDPVASAAGELGVAWVVKGSVQVIGETMRITAQLVRSSGVQEWSNTYDGSVNDVFTIQDSVATDLVSALEVNLAPEELVAGAYQPDLAAYEQFILGKLEKNKGTADSIGAAVEHFKRAIELDPAYPEAYVQLADAYGLRDVYISGGSDSYSGIPSAPVRELQHPLVAKALELDEDFGPAYAILGSMTANLDQAESLLKKAVDLSPNSAPAHLAFANLYLLRSGNFEKALEQAEIAAELDPLSPVVQYTLAKATWSVGQAEKAVAMMIDNVQRDPDFPFNYKLMARWQMQMGNIADALRWILRAREIDPDSPSHWGEFGGECYIRLSLGMIEEGIACLQAFVAANPDSIAAKREVLNANKDIEGAIALYRAAVEEDPGNIYRVNQLLYNLALAAVGGDPSSATSWPAPGNADEESVDKTLDTFESYYPEIMAGNELANALTIWPTMTAASLACPMQREAVCNRLLEMAEKGIADERLVLGGGFLVGYEQAQIHMLRGDHEAALTEFERIVDAGWRFLWATAPSALAPIADQPRFIAAFQKIEEDIAQQREDFLKAPDKPLYLF